MPPNGAVLLLSFGAQFLLESTHFRLGGGAQAVIGGGTRPQNALLRGAGPGINSWCLWLFLSL